MSNTTPLASATSILFQRYQNIIAAQADDPLAEDNRLSLKNLAWMCTEGGRDAHTLPIDKASRWLGFVQGCLASRGLIDVDEERDVSRPLFHQAYRDSGTEVPQTREISTGMS